MWYSEYMLHEDGHSVRCWDAMDPSTSFLYQFQISRYDPDAWECHKTIYEHFDPVEGKIE